MPSARGPKLKSCPKAAVVPNRLEGSEVRFLPRKASEVLSLLEVVTPRRRSVLEPVRATLFRLRVQIVRVESTVQKEQLLERFLIVEFDGGPIGPRRTAAIRSAVQEAISSVNAA